MPTIVWWFIGGVAAFLGYEHFVAKPAAPAPPRGGLPGVPAPTPGAPAGSIVDTLAAFTTYFADGIAGSSGALQLLFDPGQAAALATTDPTRAAGLVPALAAFKVAHDGGLDVWAQPSMAAYMTSLPSPVPPAGGLAIVIGAREQWPGA